jgi:hypothetical protein
MGDVERLAIPDLSSSCRLEALRYSRLETCATSECFEKVRWRATSYQV